MTGVQLIGKAAVLQRFEAAGCEAWALYQGKQFIVGGVGSEDLSEWLESFEQSGTTATYMVRMYHGDEKPTSSTGNSDYIACMGFKLTDAYEGLGIAGHSANLMQRLGAVEKQLKERKDDDNEVSTDIGAVLMGYLEDPTKLAQIAGIVKMFVTGVTPQAAAVSIPTAVPAGVQGIGAVEPGAGADVSITDDETKLQKLAAALDILGAKDPLIVPHLEKLAKLAQDDPTLFNAVISKLDLL